MLVLDDAQHADDGLLDFLDHLLATARAPDLRLALARPELLARRPALGGRRTSVVRLEPLDDVAMAELVDGLVVGLPGPARSALVARAEGIPLFAVETVRALIDRDLVVPREGRYVACGRRRARPRRGRGPRVAPGVGGGSAGRPPPEEKRVVTDASVLGVSFTKDGLLALGSDPLTLDAIVASLVRKEILVVQTDRFSAERGQLPVRPVGGAPGRLRAPSHAGTARPVTSLPPTTCVVSRTPGTTSRSSSPSTCSTPSTRRSPAMATSPPSRARDGPTSSALRLGHAPSARRARRSGCSSSRSSAAASRATWAGSISLRPRSAQDSAAARRARSTPAPRRPPSTSSGERIDAGHAAAAQRAALIYLGDLAGAIAVAERRGGRRWTGVDGVPSRPCST